MKAWTLVPLKLHQPVENPIKKNEHYLKKPIRVILHFVPNMGGMLTSKRSRAKQRLKRELKRLSGGTSRQVQVRTVDHNQGDDNWWQFIRMQNQTMVYDSGKLAFSKFQWLDEAPRCTPGRWFFMEWWLGPLWMVERKWVTQVWKTPLQKMAI